MFCLKIEALFAFKNTRGDYQYQVCEEDYLFKNETHYNI